MLVYGDFNANMAKPGGSEWDEEIAASLTAVGLEDMPVHFLLCCLPWCLYGRTCIMVRLGRGVQ